MREAYPKGRRAPGGTFICYCRCGSVYAWHPRRGNRSCPSCLRVVPADERALLPEEEREVVRLLMRAGEGER